MKKISLLVIIGAITITVSAQNVGIGTNAPDATAALEVKSTSKGVLIPRLDTAQVNSILQPPNGLIVYCTTYNKPVYWNGTDWYFFDGSRMKPLTIGELYGGGIVFYVDGSGRHGLIAAQTDISNFNFDTWGYDAGSTVYHAALGSGQGNTQAIVAYSPNVAPGLIPAKDCNDLVLNGYNDWFLPSKDELFIMYLNRGILVANGDTEFPGIYWSSTRVNFETVFTVWAVNFSENNPDNSIVPTSRTSPSVSTRAIRAF